jgi:hypothetical protein
MAGTAGGEENRGRVRSDGVGGSDGYAQAGIAWVGEKKRHVLAETLFKLRFFYGCFTFLVVMQPDGWVRRER